MTGKDFLQKMIDLYHKHGWTRFAFARTSGDSPVAPSHPEAVCFCLRGAIRRVMSDDYMAEESLLPELHRASAQATYAIHEVIGENTISRWNDCEARGRDHIIEVLTKAKEIC